MQSGPDADTFVQTALAGHAPASVGHPMVQYPPMPVLAVE